MPQWRASAGSGAPNNVHCYYADYAGAIYPSDDKIKWNETVIDKQRSLEIIKSISFTKYDILDKPTTEIIEEGIPYDASKCVVNFGVIAQEIQDLSKTFPELKDTVVKGEQFLGVNYNNIFSLMGSTVQHLISRVETLEAKIKTLEGK